MALNVLFVCTANMCRSPMAHGYLRKLLDDGGADGVEVRSAGTSFGGGFPASGNAIETALNHGFCLDDHLSTELDDELCDWADDILVMTDSHRISVLEMFPLEAAGKVRLLGEFDPDYLEGKVADTEIDDPVGEDLERYELTFQRIKRCIDAFYSEKIEG